MERLFVIMEIKETWPKDPSSLRETRRFHPANNKDEIGKECLWLHPDRMIGEEELEKRIVRGCPVALGGDGIEMMKKALLSPPKPEPEGDEWGKWCQELAWFIAYSEPDKKEREEEINDLLRRMPERR